MASKLNKILSPHHRLLSHLLFWLGYLVFFTTIHASYEEDDYTLGFIAAVNSLPVRMFATYFTLYWLIPRFLYNQQYEVFTVLFIVSAIGFGYLDRWVVHQYFVPVYMPDYDYEQYPLSHLGKAMSFTIRCYAVVLAAAAIKLIKRNYQNETLAESLAKEKLDAELKLLKAQIHPHFLFNTLNNLYALTLQNSPKSSEVVLKLSNLLDYMLYECNVPRVPLTKEIKQIQNYIGLEQLRYDDRLEVAFTSTGNLANKQIPPLLILPFVENAFKHGVSMESEHAFITIDISVRGDVMSLKVENSKNEDEQSARQASYTKGIGLKNVRRRLDLLYNDNYDLQIFDEDDSFLVVLRLNLERLQTTAPKPAKAAEPALPAPDAG